MQEAPSAHQRRRKRGPQNTHNQEHTTHTQPAHTQQTTQRDPHKRGKTRGGRRGPGRANWSSRQRARGAEEKREGKPQGREERGRRGPGDTQQVRQAGRAMEVRPMPGHGLPGGAPAGVVAAPAARGSRISPRCICRRCRVARGGFSSAPASGWREFVGGGPASRARPPLPGELPLVFEGRRNVAREALPVGPLSGGRVIVSGASAGRPPFTGGSAPRLLGRPRAPRGGASAAVAARGGRIRLRATSRRAGPPSARELAVVLSGVSSRSPLSGGGASAARGGARGPGVPAGICRADAQVAARVPTVRVAAVTGPSTDRRSTRVAVPSGRRGARLACAARRRVRPLRPGRAHRRLQAGSPSACSPPDVTAGWGSGGGRREGVAESGDMRAEGPRRARVHDQQ